MNGFLWMFQVSMKSTFVFVVAVSVVVILQSTAEIQPSPKGSRPNKAPESEPEPQADGPSASETSTEQTPEAEAEAQPEPDAEAEPEVEPETDVTTTDPFAFEQEGVGSDEYPFEEAWFEEDEYDYMNRSLEMGNIGNPVFLNMTAVGNSIRGYIEAEKFKNFILQIKSPKIPKNMQRYGNYFIKIIAKKMKFSTAIQYCFRQHHVTFGPWDTESHMFLKEQLQEVGITEIWMDVVTLDREAKSFIYRYGKPVNEVVWVPNPVTEKNYTLVNFSVTSDRCNSYKFDPPAFSTIPCDSELPFICTRETSYEQDEENYWTKIHSLEYLIRQYNRVRESLLFANASLTTLAKQIDSGECRGSRDFKLTELDWENPKEYDTAIIQLLSYIRQGERLANALRTTVLQQRSGAVELTNSGEEGICIHHRALKAMIIRTDKSFFAFTLVDLLVAIGTLLLAIAAVVNGIKLWCPQWLRKSSPPQQVENISMGTPRSILRRQPVRFSCEAEGTEQEHQALQHCPHHASSSDDSHDTLEGRYIRPYD